MKVEDKKLFTVKDCNELTNKQVRELYKKYINPKANDRKLISVGWMWIVIFIGLAGFITIYTMDPNSKDSFFLHVAKHQGNLIAGVVVAFFLGMCWKRATAAGGVAAIIFAMLNESWNISVMKEFEKKVALVIGGTSGIGNATANAL